MRLTLRIVPIGSVRFSLLMGDENKRYLLARNELSVIGKLVLRGTRIIIPSSLRDQLLHLAHEGHPRIVSMKS